MDSNNKNKAKGGKNKNNPSPAHKNFRKEERTAMNRSERRKEKNEMCKQEESFSIKSLISKFVANLFENNYAEADKDLKQIVEAKVRKRIEKASSNAKKKAKGQKPDFLDLDDDGDTDESMKDAAKPSNKKSKAEKKKEFLKRIKNKKNPKKGNK